MCPECMGMLNQPIKLRCKHSFCKNCALQIYKETRMRYKHPDNTFHCPICNTATLLIKNNENEDPIFEYSQLLNCAVKLSKTEGKGRRSLYYGMNQNSSQKDSSFDEEKSQDSIIVTAIGEIQKVSCALCTKPCSSECLNCSLPFCEKCAGFHKANERFKNHKILSYEFMKEVKEPILLEHIKSISQKKLQDETVKTTCSEHQKEELKWYSMEERKFYCDSCISENKINCVEIEKAVQILSKSIDYSQVEKIANALLKNLSNLSFELDAAEEMRKRYYDKINSDFDKLENALNSRRNSLLKKVDEIYHEQRNLLENKQKQLNVFYEKGSTILNQQVASNPVILIRLLERCQAFLRMHLNENKNIIDYDDILKGDNKFHDVYINEISVQNAFQAINQIGSLKSIKYNDSPTKNIILPSSVKYIENSKILPISLQTIPLLEILPRFSNTELLYQISTNPKQNSIFHTKCDNKGPILVLIKLSKGNIFGGFSADSWKSVGGWQKSKDSYIFRLYDENGIKLEKFLQRKTDKAIRCAVYYGEKHGMVFGDGDLWINFDQLEKSMSAVGRCYAFKDQQNSEIIKLGGRENDWDIENIEVFSIKY